MTANKPKQNAVEPTLQQQQENAQTQPRLRDLTKAFAKRIVKLHQYLNHQIEPREEIISRKVAECGTRIGATILQAEMCGSNEGFRQGISKALDEATETQYWLELLGESGYLTEEQSKSINDDLRHILNILWKIVKAKKKSADAASDKPAKIAPSTVPVSIIDPESDMPIFSQQVDEELPPEERALFDKLAQQCKRRGRKPKQIMADVGMTFTLFLLMSFSFLTTSCYHSPSQDNIDAVVQNGKMVDVTVAVNGLDMTVAESRASDKNATEAGVKNIVLKAFDAEGNVKATVTQASGDENFGTLCLKIAVGSYKFVAIANAGSNAPILISATEAQLVEVSNPSLYSCVLNEVAISGNGSQTVNMEMGKKKNAQFRIKITDDTPAMVKALQIVVNPIGLENSALDFNPTTGFASTNNKYVRTLSMSAYNLTTLSNVLLGNNILLTSSEQQLSVTINALSASNEVLYTRTLVDVPFKQSQTTTATGTFFSATTSGAFLFDVSMEDNEISLDPEDE